MEIRASRIWANGLEFGLLEAGAGPLALCLHGFPDSARTWRYLLPELAAAGFRAVAPFMRGYAPTAVPDDGRYSIGTLADDAIALHEVLGGDGHAVLIGHDWGAEAAYTAAVAAPDRWRRLVTLAVPPAALDPVLFSDYEQLKRFFYIFLFRDTPGLAEKIVAADGMAFIRRLRQDWSPGFDAADCLEHVRESLADPASLSAAISYYRAPRPWTPLAAQGRMRRRRRRLHGALRSRRFTCTAPPMAVSASISSATPDATSPLIPG